MMRKKMMKGGMLAKKRGKMKKAMNARKKSMGR